MVFHWVTFKGYIRSSVSESVVHVAAMYICTCTPTYTYIYFKYTLYIHVYTSMYIVHARVMLLYTRKLESSQIGGVKSAKSTFSFLYVTNTFDSTF